MRQPRTSTHKDKLSTRRKLGVSRGVDRDGEPGLRASVNGGNETEKRKMKRARTEGPTPADTGLTGVERRRQLQ
ncbi:hypothetical protein Bca52824_011224 [Brassica carinata]|uniref:Uncharacterized protein n=1 Tax=Brassica carinata TaxID=52824 RepID=A0A8X7WFD7_BRACI|nr:hypothetical protein Bca52824_011224 [Brassica carinata]